MWEPQAGEGLAPTLPPPRSGLSPSNTAAMQETQVQSLSQEDPLEKGKTEDEMIRWHHRLNESSSNLALTALGHVDLSVLSPHLCSKANNKSTMIKKYLKSNNGDPLGLIEV